MKNSLLAAILCCLSLLCWSEAKAEDFALTVNVAEHGTLQQAVIDAMEGQTEVVVTELKITGQIDGKDLGVIHEHAGHLLTVKKYDLSEVTIIPTDDYYLKFVDKSNLYYGEVYNYYFDDNVHTTTGSDYQGQQGIPITNYYSNDLAMLFKENTVIEEVVLPNQCKNFGASIFEGCTSLTTVTIPIGFEWKEVGDNAFKNCQNLVLTIPETVEKIGKYAFYECRSALTGDFILTNIKEIGYFAFYNHYFSSIKISSSELETLATAVFKKNQADANHLLITVDLSECSSLTTILEEAFRDNKNLESVTLPDCVRKIETAFSGCSKNLHINLPASLVEIGSWVGFDTTPNENDEDFIMIGDILVDYKGDMTITELTIPEGVSYIYNDFFSNKGDFKRNLTKVTLPASLKSLGKALRGGAALQEVVFKENSVLEEIQKEAFSNCSALTTINLPISLKSIGESAFYYCPSLAEITIPENVESIGNTIFNSCYGLSTLNYNAINVESANLFGSNYKITISMVRFGDKVERVPSYMFQSISTLRYALLPSNIKVIGQAAFKGCSLLESSMFEGSAIEEIEKEAFRGCSALTSLPNDIKIIKSNAFGSCTGLTNVPENAEEIEGNAFDGCTGLVSITLNKVKCLDHVFSGCTNIQSMTLPSCLEVLNVSDWDMMRTVSLTEIRIPDLKAWCGIKFGSYSSEQLSESSNPIQYITDFYVNGEKVEGSLEIPEGTESVSPYAFFKAKFITSVKIPKTVESIGYFAFAYIPGLKSVEFDNESLKTIGNSAFERERNSTIEKVAISNVKTWCETDFNNDYSNPIYYSHNLYVGDELVENLYVPSGTTEIKNYAFQYCYTLTSLNVPEKVTAIGDRAFSRCSYITKMTLPASLKSLGYDAFASMRKLSEVTCYAVTPPTGTDTYFFNGYGATNISDYATLKVPEEGMDLYKSTAPWNTFKNIEAITKPIIIYNGHEVEDKDFAYTYDDAVTKITGSNYLIFDIDDANADKDNVVYNGSAKTVNLTDAQPFYCPSDVTVENISYTRDFKYSFYQALYVPFESEINEWQGATIAYLNNIHQYETEDGVLVEMEYFTLKSDQTVKANVPYLIKPIVEEGEDPGEMTFSFTNKTLNATPASDGFVSCASTTWLYKILGNYQTMTDLGDNCYIINTDGNYSKLKSSSALNPFRTRLEMTPVEYGTRAGDHVWPTEIIISVDGERVTTDIDRIYDAEQDTYFDLNGRPTQMSIPGMVIRNGKVVFMK